MGGDKVQILSVHQDSVWIEVNNNKSYQVSYLPICIFPDAFVKFITRKNYKGKPSSSAKVGFSRPSSRIQLLKEKHNVERPRN